MSELEFVQTSVFTDDRYKFSGNQLATFWNLQLDSLSSREMQGIAREMNFSETTFVLPSEIEECAYKVRIFTPRAELPFAGHPTLGTAYVLKKEGLIEPSVSSVNLELGIGPIKAEYLHENSVCMYQPKPTIIEEYTDKENMGRILTISPEEIDSRFPMSFVSTGAPFLIVPIKTLTALQSVIINTDNLINTLNSFPSQKIVAFSTETHHTDSSLHIRMFAPTLGVMEDPATGSAAGPMGAYIELKSVIRDHSNGETLTLEQGYEINRPSKLLVKCQYDSEGIKGVQVTGQVKTVVEGIFHL
ncbi:phenazine biosynthesis protein [Candidatus Heimdallarchaeota archaeon B3_Heim]|nr:MAG: phenazine biosynthesis protein [Candidatus Heimdallarchaeota archaeon B3_Heim]